MDSSTKVQQLFAESEQKDLLRLLTAGSVDDGKSTLIGRLLFDSKTVYEDQVSALKRDSARHGSAGEDIDYAMLLDGLRAELEQGITIDVAYRYFSTPRRKFIIADSPGHEQYTRNMATGASTADLAVILIDAEQGVLPQTRRHTFIASLLGIKHVVVAVNKMDLVDYSEAYFQKIREDYIDFTTKLEIPDIEFIPLSALKGDNVVEESDRMPWYHGPPLLDYLETVHVASDRNLIDLRYPVQYVLRPDRSFRGFCGTVGSGILRVGDDVLVLPAGQRSKVASIVGYDGDMEEAFPPMSTTVTLADEIDVSRGDMIVHVNNVPRIERRLEAMVVWMSDADMVANETYLLKQTTNTVPALVSDVRYAVNVNTLHREKAAKLGLNEIGRAVFELHRPLAFDPYRQNHATGSFIIIDRTSNVTVGAGMILEQEPNDLIVEEKQQERPVSRDIHPKQSGVTLDERTARLRQSPATIWLTGLPKAGKSTVAYALEKRLFEMGYFAHVLDGENLRLGVSRDLGFSGNDRSENIRRAAEVAKLCNEIGMITIAAFVSPYREGRDHARQAVGEDRFVEVYVSTPLSACEKRDAEGLYERARDGRIRNFSGVSAPYEPPVNADVELPTHELTVDEAVERILAVLAQRGIIARINTGE
ncbi:MAG: sulfate adenylyltransferase subunit CysN [Candidatus Pacebacteria bacterium]|nr:sulfate adenylyltransferase subunit CysN [Candidatus Paceibacterota bacterium]